MYCKYCGQNIPDDSVFCARCGKNLDSSEPEGPAVSPYTAYSAPYVRPKKRGSCFNAVFIIALVVVFAFVGLIAAESFFSGEDSVPAAGHVSSYGEGIYGDDISQGDMRDFYTHLKGDGTEKCTVMIYMVASDLESGGGCATADIDEMLDADIGENLNVVLQSGGTSSWYNDTMSDGIVQRWEISNGKISLIKNLGKMSMLTESALSDFVSFSAEKYPADRYILIFWDHGGGSLYGFGYDEIYTDDTLFLPNIDAALNKAGVKFDIIGFDACLMASVETAYMLEPHADYLIASEETEPGWGWSYTGWLSALSKEPAIDSVELGVRIVDEFIAQNTDEDTLSVISLREIPRVYEALGSYLSEADAELMGKNYTSISTARANAKSYAEGEYDLIDIMDFADKLDIINATELESAISSAVKYRNNCTIKGSSGLSMYFPYTDLDVYTYARSFFSEIGFAGSCYSFFDNFVNVMAGGKIDYSPRTYGDTVVDYSAEEEDDNYTDYDWYNPSVSDDYDYEDEGLDLLTIEQVDDDFILPLTDEDWEDIVGIELQAMLDDGEGYIDLGSDQYFTLDEDDNLIVDFDNTWVALDGQVVAYYAESISEREDGSNVYTGYVPAELNGETYIEIILKYDDDTPDGYVAGYRVGTQSELGEGTASKGLLQFNKGDTIDFICDYYTYDGDYEDSYYFGDRITIGRRDIRVSYEDVGEAPVLVCYMITDVYRNNYWTEFLIFSEEE